jgi:hypothetical protein
VRVNWYDPDGKPEEARRKVADTIIEALKEVDLKKNLAVKAAAESLDYTSWMILAQAHAEDGVGPPLTSTMGQALGNAARIAAIARLLELKALTTAYITLTPEVLATANDGRVKEC